MKKLGLVLFVSALIISWAPAAISGNSNLKSDKPNETGEIKGSVALCEFGGSGGIEAYIPGESFIVKTAPNGAFTFHYVPEGAYTIVFEIPGQPPYTLADVVVQKNKITDVGVVSPCPDSDGDGFNAFVDCNDNNPWIYPGADEFCNDGVDNDCDGMTDENCNQYPCEPEVCDGIDNDCDGLTDEDCNQYPCEPEVCDGIDNDCDGLTDEDCNQYPCEPEVCDGIDNDCDGLTDEDLSPRPCGGGSCTGQQICEGSAGWSSCTYMEICGDAVDNDCDGTTDEVDEGGCVEQY